MSIRLFFTLSVCLLFNEVILSQSRPVLNMAALDNWTDVGDDKDVRISADGKYFSYSIQRGGIYPVRIRTVVQGTSGSWKQEVEGGEPGYFSADSRWYILAVKDRLCFIDLVRGGVRYEEGTGGLKSPVELNPSWVAYRSKDKTPVAVLKQLTGNHELRYDSAGSYEFDKSGRWWLCRLQNAARELVLYDLAKNREYRYGHVTGHAMSENGSVLVLQSKGDEGYTVIERIIPGGSRSRVWKTKDGGLRIVAMTPDESGNRLLFTVEEQQGDKAGYSIWYYVPGMAVAEKKAYTGMAGTEGWEIRGGSFQGKYLSFTLQEVDSRKADPGKSKVEIWSYKDTVLQSVQQASVGLRGYAAVLDPAVGKVIRVEQQYEKYVAARNNINTVLITRSHTGDRFWEEKVKPARNYMVDLGTGIRTSLQVRGNMFSLTWSPQGRYLVYFSPLSRHYYSFDVLRGREVNISVALPAYQFVKEEEHLSDSAFKWVPVGIAGWLPGDAGILVYDDYDIWQLDLSGVKPPVCITNGYGRRHGRALWLSEGWKSNRKTFNPGDELLLTCYDKRSRYNGFFRQVLGKKGDPEELYMGPYCFDHKGSSSLVGANDFDRGMVPLKAADARVWIVKRQSAVEAPNYFVTQDFKEYCALTDLQQHKVYNWLQTELVSFTQTDGKSTEGILYKPEDFDPSRKYPVLINYYTQFTNRLYQYPRPYYMRAASLDDNLAWYVSRGYLVFTPDIYGLHGRDRYACLASVEGAGRYLSGLSYVDSSRMGLLGHSIGGAHTMFLVTHTDKFAAAFAGAAPSVDWVSNALILSNTKGRNDFMQSVEGVMGTSIWSDKDRWVKDNPVMLADKVTMPLLIYHGERDGIPLSQPMEMYLALWRLNKPVWLLNYNEGNHTALRPTDARDLTERASQYFDHYLKGMLAPRWMTEGIPGRLKQIESRLEPDGTGRKP